jgi:hypothetical protein
MNQPDKHQVNPLVERHRNVPEIQEDKTWLLKKPSNFGHHVFYQQRCTVNQRNREFQLRSAEESGILSTQGVMGFD